MDEKIKFLIFVLEEIEYEILDDILNVFEIVGEIMYIIEEKDVEFELLSDLIEVRGDFSYCRYIRKICIRYVSQSLFCDRMCREYDEDSDQIFFEEFLVFKSVYGDIIEEDVERLCLEF